MDHLPRPSQIGIFSAMEFDWDKSEIVICGNIDDIERAGVRLTTRGAASSTITCNVVDTKVPVMSSPRPGMLVMEIKHVLVGED